MLDLDFTPPNFHEAHCLRSAIRLRASLIGTMLIIMVLWVVANRNEVASAKAMLADVQLQKEQVVIHQSRKEQMEAERARLQSREQLLQHLDNRTSLAVVLSDVSRCIGERVILTEVYFESPSVAAYAREEPVSNVSEAGSVVARPQIAQQRDPASFSASNEPHLHPGRLVLTGMATDTPEVIGFVKQLEDSTLIAQVHLEQKGSFIWSGRRGQAFVITCLLYDQKDEDQ